MDARRLLLHIGYHKTGTTWLQRVFFCNDESRFVLPWKRFDLNEWVVAPNGLVFDADALRPSFDAGFEEAERDERIPVISNERFSGNPHSAGWDSRHLADRLRALFPEARVLIMIREQQSMIRSIYYQYVREGGPLSLERYLEPPKAGGYRVPLFDFEYYAYHRLIGYYQNLYGPDRVLVLPYEMMRASLDDLTREICAFAGARVPSHLEKEWRNVGLSAPSVALKRRLNLLFVRDRVNPGAPLSFSRANSLLLRGAAGLDGLLPASIREPLEEKVRVHIEAAVGDRYRESNRRTAELTGLDLGAYGYVA